MKETAKVVKKSFVKLIERDVHFEHAGNWDKRQKLIMS
jgi:hypothetical protein